MFVFHQEDSQCSYKGLRLSLISTSHLSRWRRWAEKQGGKENRKLVYGLFRHLSLTFPPTSKFKQKKKNPYYTQSRIIRHHSWQQTDTKSKFDILRKASFLLLRSACRESSWIHVLCSSSSAGAQPERNDSIFLHVEFQTASSSENLMQKVLPHYERRLVAVWIKHHLKHSPH